MLILEVGNFAHRSGRGIKRKIDVATSLMEGCPAGSKRASRIVFAESKLQVQTRQKVGTTLIGCISPFLSSFCLSTPEIAASRFLGDSVNTKDDLWLKIRVRYSITT